MFYVGQNVITRNGNVGRIMCVDFKSPYPVLAAVTIGDIEMVYYYKEDGTNGNNVKTPMDLVDARSYLDKIQEMDEFIDNMNQASFDVDVMRARFNEKFPDNKNYFEIYVEDYVN